MAAYIVNEDGTRYEDNKSFNVSEIHFNIIIMVLNMKVNILFYIFTG